MAKRDDMPAFIASAVGPLSPAPKEPGWYRGDCHVHSRRSHAAELTPEQLASAARQVGLDFVAVTEHNTADTHEAWQQLASEDLLVILGQEIVTDTGHWLALGIEPGQVIDWSYALRDNRISQAVAQVHRVGGLCVAAHPHAPYPTGTFAYPLEGFDAVEVWNGLWTSDLPWNADNEALLDRRVGYGSTLLHCRSR